MHHHHVFHKIRKFVFKKKQMIADHVKIKMIADHVKIKMVADHVKIN